MKYIHIHNKGFTLVELMIAVTIFGIIMVAVMSIFIFSSQMSTRVEMNRVLQENVKNVLEDIAEGVRKEGIASVTDFFDTCVPSASLVVVSATPASSTASIQTKPGLCLNNGNSYVIGYYDDAAGEWKRYDSLTHCETIPGGVQTPDKTCHILKQIPGSAEYFPLTNSFTHFESLEFTYVPGDIPRVIVHMIVHPAYKKGLSSIIIQNNISVIQTTLSERLISTK